MKVRCVRLLNSEGIPEDWSPWVKVGQIYHVLELAVDHGRITVRLLGEKKSTPAIYDFRQFELVTSTLPQSWVANRLSPDYFELAPAKWTRAGFWEDYFERKPDAVSCFEEELQRIIASDP